MTCAEIDILLCDYVDGTLDGAEKAAVESHLAACDTCARLAADAALAVAFVSKAPAVETPDELLTRLLYRVPESRARNDGKGFLSAFRRWLQPLLQPRFAMGMAMTILSFSLVARFAGLPERQLTPADLHPARVWETIDDRLEGVWDRAVKYYESLRVVYEIQSRLSEWNEEDAAAGAGTSARPGPSRDTGEGSVTQEGGK